MTRLIGAALICSAGLMCGVISVREMRRRLALCRELCRMLELIAFELERFNTPLPELFLVLSASLEGEAAAFPAELRWGGSEDAEGLAVKLHFDADPVFCEVTFEEELNLMLEINGSWFYKSPKVKTIDLMSAFYDNRLSGETELTLKIFAPPASGENDPAQGDDWDTNYYFTMEKLPKIRIRFEPVEL